MKPLTLYEMPIKTIISKSALWQLRFLYMFCQNFCYETNGGSEFYLSLHHY